MCGGDEHGRPLAAVPLDDPNASEPFPWQSGLVYDAHCHPTDTMASLPQIPAMGAAVLTVMSTRSQDQDLVAALAKEQDIGSSDDASTSNAGDVKHRKIVPAFGWHPWFSYQLYDDTAADRGSSSKDLTSMDEKKQHLAAVLTPSPPLSSSSSASMGNEKEAALTTALDTLAASLPSIRPLSAFLAETRQRLQAHPAALVGEVGLDKAFRVPEPVKPAASSPDSGSITQITPGGRDGRRLSPFRVQPAHQVAVLAAQLRLAAEIQRPVSIHGVQMHGLLFSALAATWHGHEREVMSRRQRRQIAGIEGIDEDSDSDNEDGGRKQKGSDDKTSNAKPYPPTICLHSFSGPVDMLRQYLDPRIPTTVYFSFSIAVNSSTESGCQRMAEVVAACPDDRILVESDLHTAGPAMDASLEDIYRRVCAIKKWTLAEGVKRVANNFDAYILRT